MRSFIPLHHVGRDFAFRELSHASSQLLLFLRKREFHEPSPPLSVFPILNQNTIYSTVGLSLPDVCPSPVPLLHSRTCAAVIFSRFPLRLWGASSFILSTAKLPSLGRSISRYASRFVFSPKWKH